MNTALAEEKKKTVQLTNNWLGFIFSIEVPMNDDLDYDAIGVAAAIHGIGVNRVLTEYNVDIESLKSRIAPYLVNYEPGKGGGNWHIFKFAEGGCVYQASVQVRLDARPRIGHSNLIGTALIFDDPSKH